MSRTSSLVVLLCTLPLTASFGCSESLDATETPAPGTDSPSSTALPGGWRRTLSNNFYSPAPHATGEHVHFQLRDERLGPTRCTGKSDPGCALANPICTTSGDWADSVVESVVCEGACTAVTTPTGRGMFDVDVVASESGPAHVVVRVRDADGSVLETEATLAFVRPDRITITRPFLSSPHGLAYAAVPGASFRWCSSIEANGAAVQHTPEDLRVMITGGAREAPQLGGVPDFGRCDTFTATEPGEIGITVSYGNLVRRERIRVIALSDVVQSELVVIGGEATALARSVAVEVDPLRDAPAVTHVGVDSCAMQSTFVVERATSRDGVVALGPTSALNIHPEHLVMVDTPSPDPAHGTIMRLDARATGEGAITALLGSTSLVVPLSVTGNCRAALEPLADAAPVDPDGGADAAGP